ncbi:MAG: hypothetical protein LPJ89_08220, partial [Hymenobacteraceae bacterium]|nr:hypothetical protein [Hymenobacteraceae bacterium]
APCLQVTTPAKAGIETETVMKRNIYFLPIVGLLAAPAAFAQSGSKVKNPVTAIEKITYKVVEVEVSEQLQLHNSRWINGLYYYMNGSRDGRYYVNGICRLGMTPNLSVRPHYRSNILTGTSAAQTIKPSEAPFQNQQNLLSHNIEPLRNTIPKP